ncbi:FGGY family carbohydrate kinase [Nonomuraea sp. NPDC050663]|uniref:FGGY family carbohydrate kinase n=1 Tax=Nonomuraea sp. NPDC050663 TaxID=3364370 RepID=UPI003798EE64
MKGAICVDAGTTMIKAVAYDGGGRETALARRPTRVTRPATGHSEQDMDEVWAAVVACVREVAPAAGPVDFLAITAQGDGLWLVDERNRPTGPAILWNDGRAAAAVAGWEEQGVLARAFPANGSVTFAGLPNAILAWLNEHDPARLERSAAALTCGGWIFANLTGRRAIDSSDASAPFTDLATGDYSADLLALYGMSWARRLLPARIADEHRTAPLTTAELGLPPGTPVVMAPYDIAATAIGVGATEPGQACGILGTTLCTEIVTDDASPGSAEAGFTIALGLPRRHLRVFPTLAGVEVIHWACALLGLRDPEELGRRAAPDSRGLSFLPYLSPAGERAPFRDPGIRGSMHGLTVEHGPEHVARAVLEGLSLVIRDCLEAAGSRPGELRVCGGGAASEVWTQLIADATGVTVLRPVDTEAGARGAYQVGRLQLGQEPAAPAVRDEWVPRRDLDDAYERFVRLRGVR